MTYAENAPKALIELYEKRLRTDGSLSDDGSFVPLIKLRPPRKIRPPQGQLEILEALLCNRRMEPAWKSINKSIKSEDGYNELLSAIRESMRLARRSKVTQTDRREKYEDIAKRAEKLAKLIIEPRYKSGVNVPYTGDLDLQAYELLPESIASTLGAESYTAMNSRDRATWAYSLLPEWPTIVELLEQLAIRSRRCGGEDTSLVERDRGSARVVIFVRELYKHFYNVNAQFNGFAAIATITSITMGDKNLTSKAVRRMIFGAAGKLPITGRRKSVLNV